MHVSNGARIDSRGMRAIALHEIGHVLGLSHSADVHDVMAPLVRVADLSPFDCATVRLLYTFPAGRVR
jgi:predicted Zn-dependent protease